MYFNPRGIGASLSRVAVDTLVVRGKHVESWLYQADQGVDLLLWIDGKKRLIKQRIQIYGQVVEWNVVEGLKTGITVEFGPEIETTGMRQLKDLKARVYGKQAQCIYDEQPQRASVEQAVAILQNCLIVDDEFHNRLIDHFAKGEPKKISLKPLKDVPQSKRSVWSKFSSFMRRILFRKS